MPSEQTNRRALLEMVEGATGPDEELDALILCATLAPADAHVEQSRINGAWVIYHGLESRSGRTQSWPMPMPWRLDHMSITASIDAALALVERVKPDGRAPQDVLSDAIERMGRDRFNPATSVVPQIARYVLIELLSALIAQEAGHAVR